MGTYLSTPVTEKCHESGDSLDCPLVKCSWGVVDMQGWRKSMEDSHIAVTDISVPKHLSDVDAKVFGVFDGHGGPEVARFCQLYLISVLTQQSTWKHPETADQEIMDVANKGVGQALVETFHALDRMIDDPRRR
jgi:serine/threonine protein phosphatase PrpC